VTVYPLFGVALAGVVVLGTLVAVKWYLPRKFARDDRARRAVPHSTVRDLVADARVRVIGTAHAIGESLIGPHTGKPCLAYLARAYDEKLEVRETSNVVAFRVQDATGAIVVVVDHVKLDLVYDRTEPKELGAGVIARNVSRYNMHTDLREQALRPDARVAVVARVARDDRGELVLAGTAQEPVVISTWHASLKP
jgi:hypothetical protein